jgi:hypothetical protein
MFDIATNFLFSGQAYKTYDEVAELPNVDPSSVKRDTIALNLALGCLGVKPSTFHTLVHAQKTEKINEMLEEALVTTTAEFTHRPALGNHLDIPEKKGHVKVMAKKDVKGHVIFEPNTDHTADFPTILEAFQYLKKIYVDDVYERKGRKLAKAKSKSNSALSAIEDNDPKLVEVEDTSSSVLAQFSELFVDDPLYGYGSSRGNSRRGSYCSGATSPSLKPKSSSSGNTSPKLSKSPRTNKPTTAMLSKRRASAYK